LEDGVDVEIMWVPAHVGLEGHEIVEERERHAALNGTVFDRPLSPVDFQGLARSVLLTEWQGKWNDADAHSILSKVSLGLRFKGRTGNLFPLSRSHLSRFRIVEEAMFVCLKDYETVDHSVWHCGRVETKKRRLTDAPAALDMQLGTPVRDLCAQNKWRAMMCCLDFLGSLGIRI
jgi:hypothetical protein